MQDHRCRKPSKHQNVMIFQHHAPGIPAENFTAMIRLDHNRALTQLDLTTGSKVSDIKNIAIWGNHSPTIYFGF